MPYIESNYNVNKVAQHRYIGGSSMGGLISWYTLLNYPNEFAGAICMSTHWPGIFSHDDEVFVQFKQYIANNIAKLSNQKVYFDYGDSTLDAMYPKLQAQIDDLFMAHKYPAKLWQSQYFPGEDTPKTRGQNAYIFRLSLCLEKPHGLRPSNHLQVFSYQ